MALSKIAGSIWEMSFEGKTGNWPSNAQPEMRKSKRITFKYFMMSFFLAFLNEELRFFYCLILRQLRGILAVPTL